MDDHHHDEPGVPPANAGSRGLPPAIRPRQTTMGGNLWQSEYAPAVSSDESVERHFFPVEDTVANHRS